MQICGELWARDAPRARHIFTTLVINVLILLSNLVNGAYSICSAPYTQRSLGTHFQDIRGYSQHTRSSSQHTISILSVESQCALSTLSVYSHLSTVSVLSVCPTCLRRLSAVSGKIFSALLVSSVLSVLSILAALGLLVL